MATPGTRRDNSSLIDKGDPIEGQSYERLEYMVSPKGMYATMQPQQADPDTAIIAKNFCINEEGKYEIRRPMDRKFFDAAITPIGMIGVTDPTGSGLLLLFHETGIKWSVDGGTTWSNATGPALDGGLGGSFVLVNYAMWDIDTLLFTTNANLGAPELYQFVISTKIYSLVAASPASQILTVFGGRAIVSPGDSRLLQWSVKNDHTNWSGTGSGNESLRLSPGRSSDDIIGLFPINDTQMFIVRTGSVWLAELTGNVDVPFTFSFLYQVNLVAARALSYSTEGIYALGLDDVFLLTISGPESIGIPIIGGWVDSDTIIYNPYQASAVYEPLRSSLYIHIPFTSTANLLNFIRGTDSGLSTENRMTDSGDDRITDYPLNDPSLLLVYNRRQKKWTYYSYNITIFSISVANFRTPAVKGLLFTTTHNQAFIEFRTDQLLPNDGNEEMDLNNNFQPIEAQILTGAIGPQTASEGTTIAKVEVDLTSGQITAATRRTEMYLYRTRSGPRTTPVDAVTYSDKSVADAAGRNLSVTKKIKATKKFWQLDVRLSKCTTYVLEGIYVYLARGAPINL